MFLIAWMSKRFLLNRIVFQLEVGKRKTAGNLATAVGHFSPVAVKNGLNQLLYNAFNVFLHIIMEQISFVLFVAYQNTHYTRLRLDYSFLLLTYLCFPSTK